MSWRSGAAGLDHLALKGTSEHVFAFSRGGTVNTLCEALHKSPRREGPASCIVLSWHLLFAGWGTLSGGTELCLVGFPEIFSWGAFGLASSGISPEIGSAKGLHKERPLYNVDSDQLPRAINQAGVY